MPKAPLAYRSLNPREREKRWASRQESRRAKYQSSEWLALRLYVLKRDRYLCQECQRQGRLTAVSRYAQVHHIRAAVAADDVLCDAAGLETLCPGCHHKLGIYAAMRGPDSAFVVMRATGIVVCTVKESFHVTNKEECFAFAQRIAEALSKGG